MRPRPGDVARSLPAVGDQSAASQWKLASLPAFAIRADFLGLLRSDSGIRNLARVRQTLQGIFGYPHL
jgi:hypothetical protein